MNEREVIRRLATPGPSHKWVSYLNVGYMKGVKDAAEEEGR